MAARIWLRFPPAAARYGLLYVLGWKDGTTKVGRSRRVAGRLQLHNRRNGGIAWAHIFGNPCSGICEYAAMQELLRIGTRIGNSETFSGLTKETAIAVCRSVIRDRLSLQDADRLLLVRRQVEGDAWEAFKRKHFVALEQVRET